MRSKNMLEVEMKFPVDNFTGLENKLAAASARGTAPIQEADHYFNAPDRDFARTDEALRLRRIGPKNRVTYKGPKTDKETKTRKEIEVPLAEGAETAEGFVQILQNLGYRPVAVVRKQRRIYQLERNKFHLEICLDEVAELGSFAELEIVAPEDQLDKAQATLLLLAGELGLKKSERRSYLELLL